MESAAFFYVCLSQKVPFAALRAISNKVEVRNKAAWNIPQAVQNLETAIREAVGSWQ
jgi:futalosine hydrolase